MSTTFRSDAPNPLTPTAQAARGRGHSSLAAGTALLLSLALAACVTPAPPPPPPVDPVVTAPPPPPPPPEPVPPTAAEQALSQKTAMQAIELLEAGQEDQARNELQRALQQQPYRPHLVKRPLARPLRHFQMAPRIAFRTDSATGRTQLSLVCSDRPGLLAVVALALRERRVRVHDARIATFGERAEDFFQITDQNDRPLGAEAEQALLQALTERLDPNAAGIAKEHHAST